MKRSALSLLIPVILWGGAYTAIKLALRELEPLEIIAARFLLATPVLFVILRRKGLRIWPIEKKPLLALASFIVFLHFWIMATGMTETSASKTAWILTTSPVFIAIAAWLLLREPFRAGQWLGVMLAGFGVAVLTTNGHPWEHTWIESRGDMIVLASCLTWALFTVTTRKVTSEVHPLVATFWTTCLAGVVFLPLVLIGGGLGVYASMSVVSALSLIYLGVLCLAVAFSVWADALARLPAAEVGMFLYFEPLAAVLFASVILGEVVTVWLLAGAALISLGVWITRRASRVGRAVTGA